MTRWSIMVLDKLGTVHSPRPSMFGNDVWGKCIGLSDSSQLKFSELCGLLCHGKGNETMCLIGE